jgi:hypothetical protein
MTDFRVILLEVIFLFVGLAGMRSVFKNARTTDDRSSGAWMIITLTITCLALLGLLVSSVQLGIWESF